jgi:hypothetical protein
LLGPLLREWHGVIPFFSPRETPPEGVSPFVDRLEG